MTGAGTFLCRPVEAGIAAAFGYFDFGYLAARINKQIHNYRAFFLIFDRLGRVGRYAEVAAGFYDGIACAAACTAAVSMTATATATGTAARACTRAFSRTFAAA